MREAAIMVYIAHDVKQTPQVEIEDCNVMTKDNLYQFDMHFGTKSFCDYLKHPCNGPVMIIYADTYSKEPNNVKKNIHKQSFKVA